MVIPKTNFGLPGQIGGLQRRRTQRAKRTTSFPMNASQRSPSTMAVPQREGIIKWRLKISFSIGKSNQFHHFGFFLLDDQIYLFFSIYLLKDRASSVTGLKRFLTPGQISQSRQRVSF